QIDADRQVARTARHFERRAANCTAEIDPHATRRLGHELQRGVEQMDKARLGREWLLRIQVAPMGPPVRTQVRTLVVEYRTRSGRVAEQALHEAGQVLAAEDRVQLV